MEFAVGGLPIVNSVPSSNIQRPTISWAAVGGASKYEVYISGTPVIRQQVTSISYTVATALSPGKYTVWVRAFDTVGNKYGGWSNPVEWTIVAGNLAVISPIANSTVQTPTISWTLVQGSSSYEMFIATKANPGTAVFRLSGIPGGSYQVSTPLAPGQYRVWIRALSSSSNTYGAWSVPIDWTISSTTLIGDPLDVATELVLAVVPNKLSELVSSSTFSQADFDLNEHPTAPVVVAESAEDSAIQIKAVAADILPVVRQPAVLEANDVQEMDNVLAGWNNHAWWDEAVQSSVARSGATVGENGATSSSTSSASAGVLSALLMLVPKLIRQKRQE